MTSPSKRPASVTWLAAMVFLLATAHLCSVPYALSRRAELAALPVPFPMSIRIGLSGAWGVIWLVPAWGLWRLRPWGRRLALILTPVYAVYLIGWDLVFARGTYERGQLGCATLLSLLGIGWVSYVLTKPRVRDAFEGNQEDWEQQDGT